MSMNDQFYDTPPRRETTEEIDAQERRLHSERLKFLGDHFPQYEWSYHKGKGYIGQVPNSARCVLVFSVVTFDGPTAYSRCAHVWFVFDEESSEGSRPWDYRTWHAAHSKLGRVEL